MAPHVAAALTVIANQDGPPNPLNVIDASDPPGEDYIVCSVVFSMTQCFPIDGVVTSVEIRTGADVGHLDASGHSDIAVLGGATSWITARDDTPVLVDLPPDTLPEPNRIGSIEAFDGASIEFSSGSIFEIRAQDDASVHVGDGSTSLIQLAGNATLLHNGVVTGQISLTGQSSMVLDGQLLSTGLDTVVGLSDTAFLEILGGLISDNGLQAAGDSRVEMSGGSSQGVGLADQASMLWTGGEISSLSLFGTAEITIGGHAFAIDGTPVGPGLVGATSGLLTGTLANGDALSVPFQRTSGTRLILVPEPSAFGLVGLGLAALAARRAPAGARPRGSRLAALRRGDSALR